MIAALRENFFIAGERGHGVPGGDKSSPRRWPRYALVWSVLAGAAVSVRIDGHIRVTFVPDLLRPGWRWCWSRTCSD